MRHLNQSAKTKQSGFTIIELMIATTIFSIVLMIALAAVLRITRMYYQGTLQARTQNRVREIVDQIADEIRYSPGEFLANNGQKEVLSAEVDDSTQPHQYYGQYCIGDIRYRYLLGYQVDKSAELPKDSTSPRSARRALIREKLSGGCNQSLDLNDNGAVSSEFIKPNSDSQPGILDEHMRLLEFVVQPLDHDTYKIKLSLAYGDDDLIDYNSEDEQVYVCSQNNLAKTYCAVSRLEVIVNKSF